MSAYGDKPAPPRLRERLRGWLGLGQPSIRRDIAEALDEPAAGDGFTPQERTMLRNVLALKDMRVGDVMVPRADVVATPITATLEEVLALFRTAGHSRLPVYGDTLDDPRGMVHIRDFVDHLARAAEAQARARGVAVSGADVRLDLKAPLATAEILRPVLYAPPSMPALDLLVKMQATHTHMALVIDEYGGTDGLVSIEDVVETVVGDIEDEHDDPDAPAIERVSDGVWKMDARADLDQASAATGRDLSTPAGKEEVDTVGGLVAALAGRLPLRGEIVAGPDGLEFEVLDADQRRLKRIKATLRPAARRPRAIPADDSKPAGPPAKAAPGGEAG
ncbi:MAG: HlyC/CorC family transporter [Hyphomicrobiales bacterium]|nr:hemolysin family protein [Hyphomicrobiales bacterium]MDE2017286.1 HlyC/CorC family transporter [Hyphomicrobiales bacterium]